MFHSFKGLLTTVLIVFFCGFVTAQDGFTTAGGDASSNTGYISYSLGQVSYQTVESTAIIMSLGVQQSFEVLTLNTERASAPILKPSIYPNPAKSDLFLTWENEYPENIEVKLIDTKGSLLLQKVMHTADSRIPIENIAPGAYFLRVSVNETIIESFKFIKAN